MINLKFSYEDIEEVIDKKDRSLVIIFKRNERTEKLKQHLKKQFPGDHIDRNYE